MKEYDIVELIKERDRYKKENIYEGMFGVIMSDKCINGEWYVVFSEFHTGRDIADILIKETDLKVHEHMPLDRIPAKEDPI